VTHFFASRLPASSEPFVLKIFPLVLSLAS